MSLLKQIDDKGAVIEWCPIPNYGNLVALGTKDSAGSGFDDYGGELELHLMNFSDRSTSSVLVGRAKATSRFASIAWSKMAVRSAEYSYGLIATGMIDGTINIWDPSKLASDDPEPLIVAVEQHNGPIHGLQFNPHRDSSHLLASGGADGEIYVMALERPETPNVFIPAPPPNNTKHTADITKVAWNTQVAHILASSAQNGSCIVWDLRQKKAWCELKDPSGGCVSDIAWNPDQGLHLITAGGDDKNPVLKLWDLRSSTSLPLATLQGHTEGILSVSWCPSDPSLLLSCGKDNRTMLWDLFNLQPVYDIPSNVVDTHQSHGFNTGIPSMGAADENNFMFNNLASTVGNRRYHVAWSPCLPAVISACSFDRSVQFYSLSGAKSKLGRAPKWLRKPIGASFGFGGKLATFDNRPVAEPKKGAAGSVEMKLYQVVENPELVDISNKFQEALTAGDYPAYCSYKSETVRSHFDKQIWELMKIICFDKSAREGLLNYLGFDSNQIISTTNEYMQNIVANREAKSSSSFDEAVRERIQACNLNVSELVENVLTANEAEPIIRQALVVGNFTLAVDCCIEAGLMTEALLLAQCGDNTLWLKTQQIYFEKHRNKKFFLGILQSIIKNELMDYVNSSDLSKWKETLAILSTYGKSEEFPVLCERLGERLFNEKNDLLSSTLCYMCAININQTIAHWIINLKQSIYANNNQIDIYALQEFIEKVIIYTQYNITTGATGENPAVQLSDECLHFFTEYSKLLASQGKTNIAAKYLKSNTLEEQILRDRLYHSEYLKPMGSRPPPFPFESVIVNAAVAVEPQSLAPNQVHTRTRGGSLDKTHPQASHAAQKGATHSSHIPVHQQHSHHTPAASQLQTVPVQSHVAAQTQSQPQVIQQQQHTPIQVSPTPQLPPGWLQLIDPSSNRPYYVDQATGQSQWDPPVAAPVVTVPVVTQPVVSTPPQPQPQSQTHQPVAQSFQNPNPAMITTTQAKEISQSIPAALAASSTPLVVDTSVSVSDGSSVAVLQNMFNSLQGKPLNATDKRQLPAISQSMNSLIQQHAGNQISAETLGKLDQLVAALNVKNVHAATAIHTDLVNTCWNQHKDWIRGLKYLVQLVGKY